MEISKVYDKLLRGKGPTVLSVVAKDGSVQSSLVWSDLEGGVISINMLTTAPKLKRILRSKKATLLKADPENEDNYISVRCSLVRVESEGAIEHLNKLTKRHLGKEKWYGDVVPDNDEEKRDCVVVYLKPEKVYFT
ncbi:MAG: hypothetical protein ACR2P1_20210 [Pseudomonadales bacterium]